MALLSPSAAASGKKTERILALLTYRPKRAVQLTAENKCRSAKLDADPHNPDLFLERERGSGGFAGDASDSRAAASKKRSYIKHTCEISQGPEGRDARQGRSRLRHRCRRRLPASLKQLVYEALSY
jgi:hypothetical protein